MFGVQAFRSINNIIRSQASNWSIFNLRKDTEEKKVFEELSGQYYNIKKLYKEATKGEHDFLYLNIRKSEAWRNFETKLKVNQ